MSDERDEIKPLYLDIVGDDEDDETMAYEDLTRRPNRKNKNRHKLERFSDDD